MKFWIKNIKTEKIVCAFLIPKGCRAREEANKWILQNNLRKEDFKILYKNPFLKGEKQ